MEHCDIRRLRRGGADGVHEAGIRIDADVPLHAEVPLIALLRLAHFRVALPCGILGGTRSGDEGGIHDGAFLHEVSFLREECVHDLQETFLQTMFFQEVTELADGRLVGRSIPHEIEAEEALEGASVIDLLLRLGIGQVEPLLEEVDFEHEEKITGRPSDLVVVVVGADGGDHLLPWNDVIHLGEELLPAQWLAVGKGEEGGLWGHGEKGKDGLDMLKYSISSANFPLFTGRRMM